MDSFYFLKNKSASVSCCYNYFSQRKKHNLPHSLLHIRFVKGGALLLVHNRFQLVQAQIWQMIDDFRFFDRKKNLSFTFVQSELVDFFLVLNVSSNCQNNVSNSSDVNFYIFICLNFFFIWQIVFTYQVKFYSE